MKRRVRQRIDWDEEVRKTERIRRRGLFITVLGLCVVGAVSFGAGHMNPHDIEVSRKVIFAVCVVITLFLGRVLLWRRERLRLKQNELKDQEAIQSFRQWKQEKNID